MTTVANTGNVSLDVKAKLKVKDVFGRTVKVFPTRKLDGLLPHQHAEVTERWADLPRLVTEAMTALGASVRALFVSSDSVEAVSNP